MNENKEIEEMAKEIQKSVDGCANYWTKLIATYLYEQGYRNVKDKVAEEIAKAKKETAKEIIEMLVPPCEICDKNWHKGCLCLRAKLAEKIAEKYGVEVE